MATIEVNNLTKTYSFHKKKAGLKQSIKGIFSREILYTHAVKGVSFSIEQGEIVGFLGPNGAGKTTTLKMLSGILYPTSGEATVLDHIPWQRKAAFQKQFALVMGQKNQLWWDLPAIESFLLNQAIYEIPEKRFRNTLNELADLLDIRDILEVPVRKLSLGQRMKAELVAALLHSPKVLLLDEPTIGLDVVSQNNIREFLKTYNKKEKTTIMLTSHYMEDVEALCERVIVMNAGEIGYDGSLPDLLNQYVDSKYVTATFTQDVKKSDLKKVGPIVEWNKRKVTLEVPKEQVKPVATTLLNDFPIDDIFIDEVAIEEVVRRMFASS